MRAALLILLGVPALPAAGRAGWSEMKTFNGSLGPMNYYLFTPQGASSQSPLPLVLFLHGGVKSNGKGAPGLPTDAFAKPAHQKDFPCFILRPVALEGKNWVSPRGPRTASHSLPPEPAPSVTVVLELLEEILKGNPVDRKKVHVTGASMGGYGTFDVIERRPDLFASAIPICGGGDPSKAESLKGLKIWIFHCVDDNVVPAKGSRDMCEALLKARGEKPAVEDVADRVTQSSSDGRIRYTEYKSGKHLAWDKAYGEPELTAWMAK